MSFVGWHLKHAALVLPLNYFLAGYKKDPSFCSSLVFLKSLCLSCVLFLLRILFLACSALFLELVRFGWPVLLSVLLIRAEPCKEMLFT